MEQLAAANGAGPLFHRVMKRVALRDGQARPEPFAPPPDTVEVTVCAASGLLATDDCPEHRRLFVPKAEVPAKKCDAHRKRDGDVRNGLLAGPNCPRAFTAQRVFEVLPPAYAQWQAEHPRRAPPGGWSPLCPRKGPVHGEVVVKWPRAGEVFLLEPGWDERTQTLELRAEAEGIAPDVRWFVDGSAVPSEWPVRRGQHELFAEAGGRRSQVVTFEVR
jgi:membrane carboxypeptidase/penicillin-binding protein PbpC